MSGSAQGSLDQLRPPSGLLGFDVLSGAPAGLNGGLL
jgi:hypothetical protein